MLSSEKDLDDERARITSTGLFVHGKRDLSDAVRQNILAMKRFAVTTKVTTSDELAAMAS